MNLFAQPIHHSPPTTTLTLHLAHTIPTYWSIVRHDNHPPIPIFGKHAWSVRHVPSFDETETITLHIGPDEHLFTTRRNYLTFSSDFFTGVLEDHKNKTQLRTSKLPEVPQSSVRAAVIKEILRLVGLTEDSKRFSPNRGVINIYRCLLF
jgi:hypothetical protein